MMPQHATTNGAPIQGAPSPSCPECGGPMWDNRADKRSARAPDFRCRDQACDGRIWPGQRRARDARLSASGQPIGSAELVAIGDIIRGQTRTSLCRGYLAVTDFVLSAVRERYQAAGVTCTDATLAAIAATLFIAANGRNGSGPKR